MKLVNSLIVGITVGIIIIITMVNLPRTQSMEMSAMKAFQPTGLYSSTNNDEQNINLSSSCLLCSQNSSKNMMINADSPPQGKLRSSIFRNDEKKNTNHGANSWVQLGGNIEHEIVSRRAVAMSSDAKIVAVGQPRRKRQQQVGNGFVQVYQYSSDKDQWFQMGQDIVSFFSSNINVEDETLIPSFGSTLTLSDNGLVLAVSDGQSAVEIYHFTTTNSPRDTTTTTSTAAVAVGMWMPLGDSHVLEPPDAVTFGVGAPTMSADGMVVAVGDCSFYDDDDDDYVERGRVLVYSYVPLSNTWRPMGSPLLGQQHHDHFGMSVSLSGDGTTLAVGAPGRATFCQPDVYCDPEFVGKMGTVSVYKFRRVSDYLEDWDLMVVDNSHDDRRGRGGVSLVGEGKTDGFGKKVQLSANGQVLAVGAPYHDGSGHQHNGRVRVYHWTTYDGRDTWIPLGQPIDGEASHDWSGGAIDLSENGKVIVVGAYAANDSKNDVEDSGHARVFRYSEEHGKWNQIGDDICGTTEGEMSGYSVGLSADGTKMMTGNYAYQDDVKYSGLIRVYQSV